MRAITHDRCRCRKCVTLKGLLLELDQTLRARIHGYRDKMRLADGLARKIERAREDLLPRVSDEPDLTPRRETVETAAWRRSTHVAPRRTALQSSQVSFGRPRPSETMIATQPRSAGSLQRREAAMPRPR